MVKIKSIAIQGFRSFGKEKQVLIFKASASAVWAPNSNGKTSLAEALEFLFTGNLSRKDLTASSQDEFSDSLRNAFTPSQIETYVEIVTGDASGVEHTIRRTLLSDYGKRATCESKLQVDGMDVDISRFERMGIHLAQPPMAAPILMHHSLGYLFSAKPQERSMYFKALLEVNDLEVFYQTLEKEIELLVPKKSLLIEKLEKAATINELSFYLSPLLKFQSKVEGVKSTLTECARRLLGDDTSSDDTIFDKFKNTLKEKQSSTFPMEGFSRKKLLQFAPLDENVWGTVEKYHDLSKEIDKKINRLLGVFSEALKLEEVQSATTAIDCPVCDTEKSLEKTRIDFMREKLKETSEFRISTERAKESLQKIKTFAESLERVSNLVLPAFSRWDSESRKEKGFSVGAMKKLLEKEAENCMDDWLKSYLGLLRAHHQIRKVSRKCKRIIDKIGGSLPSSEELENLRSGIAEVEIPYKLLVERESIYSENSERLYEKLKVKVGQSSNTSGWLDLQDMIDNESELTAALSDEIARNAIRKLFNSTLREIAVAKEAVLSERFGDLSDEIKRWWDLLRPNEPTFFESLKPRSQAKRTIDFKAGLSPTGERKNYVIRDVVSVFSYSQLNCLGLAAFLARSIRDRNGFLILDDPILASDDDHRAPFVHDVIKELMDAGIQIVLLTQDQKTWKDLQLLYRHINIDAFQLSLETPNDGTIVVNTGDDLSVMLARVKPYVRSRSPELRKQAVEKLRDAAERFCKETIIKNDGKRTSLSDLSETLSKLIPRVEPFLTDPSHSGKLWYIEKNLNPGSHDDDIPDGGILATTFGDLSSFKRMYLG